MVHCTLCIFTQWYIVRTLVNTIHTTTSSSSSNFCKEIFALKFGMKLKPKEFTSFIGRRSTKYMLWPGQAWAVLIIYWVHIMFLRNWVKRTFFWSMTHDMTLICKDKQTNTYIIQLSLLLILFELTIDYFMPYIWYYCNTLFLTKPCFSHWISIVRAHVNTINTAILPFISFRLHVESLGLPCRNSRRKLDCANTDNMLLFGHAWKNRIYYGLRGILDGFLVRRCPLRFLRGQTWIIHI